LIWQCTMTSNKRRRCCATATYTAVARRTDVLLTSTTARRA